MNREALIAAFLARHGYAEAARAPLAPDASFRRYLRLSGGKRPAVLMDAPPPEDVRPFVRMAAHIAGIGLSAPEIIAADAANGLVLEEDLGDGVVGTVESRTAPPLAGLGSGADQGRREGESLSSTSGLAAAVDCLIALQRAAPPPGLLLWDAPAMTQAALGTLLDWWWPAAFGGPAPPAARDDFAAALAAMLCPLAGGPRCFVHRDFFAGNLIWLPQREGLRRVGILDFQSAALGHPAYDLASLLQDARQDAAPGAEKRAIAQYLGGRPDLDPQDFRTAYAICAAQRHLRVACQWVRLAVRDRRPHYLAHGPRTWRLLDKALTHQAAAPLAAAMDRWIPPALRTNPEGLAA
ncbi:MAG TPA: phosphotransferase [Acetobacteraceae bacterium]|nr:phosphotransferase [Acetobacteraceae bacterium]